MGGGSGRRGVEVWRCGSKGGFCRLENLSVPGLCRGVDPIYEPAYSIHIFLPISKKAPDRFRLCVVFSARCGSGKIYNRFEAFLPGLWIIAPSLGDSAQPTEFKRAPLLRYNDSPALIWIARIREPFENMYSASRDPDGVDISRPRQIRGSVRWLNFIDGEHFWMLGKQFL